MSEWRVKISYDHFLIQSFAGELIGHTYPLSPEMTKMVLDGFKWTDEQFENKLAEWLEIP